MEGVSNVYHDPTIQAFCNNCGGQLEILEVDKENPFPYRCLRCGQVPSSVDRVEPQNLGKTYIVNLNHKKGKETL